MLALLATLAVRIESSPALPKNEALVGETLTSRSDKAVGLVDMVLLVKILGFEGLKGFRGGRGVTRRN